MIIQRKWSCSIIVHSLNAIATSRDHARYIVAKTSAIDSTIVLPTLFSGFISLLERRISPKKYASLSLFLGDSALPPPWMTEQSPQAHLDTLGLIDIVDLDLSSLFLLFYKLKLFRVSYSYYTPFDDPLHRL